MTDVLLKEVLNKEPFTWNISGMNFGGEVRELYLQALRLADNFDYSALLNFVRSGKQ